MIETATHHGTVVVERTLGAPAARLYGAFADPRERERWAAPSDTAVFTYEEADFRVGGRDLARCGPKQDPRYSVEARYLDIVPARRIIWTETIHDGDKMLAANLATLELMPEGQSTQVRVTVQVASLVGAAMIENTRAGHEGSLAGMARYLEGR